MQYQFLSAQTAVQTHANEVYNVANNIVYMIVKFLRPVGISLAIIFLVIAAFRMFFGGQNGMEELAFRAKRITIGIVLLLFATSLVVKSLDLFGYKFNNDTIASDPFSADTNWKEWKGKDTSKKNNKKDSETEKKKKNSKKNN